jgi:hypothetical protein
MILQLKTISSALQGPPKQLHVSVFQAAQLQFQEDSCGPSMHQG